MHNTTMNWRRGYCAPRQPINQRGSADRPRGDPQSGWPPQWTTWTGSSSIIRLPRSYSVGLSAQPAPGTGRVWLERTNA